MLDIIDLNVVQDFFGKFDFFGIIDVLKAIESCEVYVALGQPKVGIGLLIWSSVFLVLRIILTVLTLIFVLRVWKIVSHHYFKIIDEESNAKKQIVTEKYDAEVQGVAIEEKYETVELEHIEETKEIEIPVPMDATKEVEIPKQIEKPKEKIKPIHIIKKVIR